MAFTGGSTKSTGDVITAAIWNNYLGASGSIDETAPAKVTTAGDLVYGTGTNAIARLGIGSANTVLKSSGSAPAWGTVAATEVTANNWKLFYSNGSGAVQELALAASGVLTANGTSAAPTFEAAAGGGGAWDLVATDTTQYSSSSSSLAVAKTFGSISIAATDGMLITAEMWQDTGTTTSAWPKIHFFKEINGTATGGAGSPCQLKYSVTAGNDFYYYVAQYIGPRETGYGIYNQMVTYGGSYNNGSNWYRAVPTEMGAGPDAHGTNVTADATSVGVAFCNGGGGTAYLKNISLYKQIN